MSIKCIKVKRAKIIGKEIKSWKKCELDLKILMSLETYFAFIHNFYCNVCERMLEENLGMQILKRNGQNKKNYLKNKKINENSSITLTSQKMFSVYY